MNPIVYFAQKKTYAYALAYASVCKTRRLRFIQISYSQIPMHFNCLNIFNKVGDDHKFDVEMQSSPQVDFRERNHYGI